VHCLQNLLALQRNLMQKNVVHFLFLFYIVRVANECLTDQLLNF
jgi:hypothetical protein